MLNNENSIFNRGVNAIGTAALASAVAALCAPTASASTVTARDADATNISFEGLKALAKADLDLGNIAVTLTANYDIGDEITFTVGGTGSPTLTAGVTGAFDCAAVGETWSEVAAARTTTSRTYRLSVAAVGNGASCTLSGVQVDSETVGATLGNTVQFKASGYDASAAATFDTAGAFSTVTKVVEEFKFAVTEALDGQVSAKYNNKAFVDDATDFLEVEFTVVENLLHAADAGTNDLVWSLTSTGGLNYLANTGEVTFANIFAAAAGKNSVAIGAAGVLGGTGTAASGIVNSITITDGSATTTGTYDLTFDNDGTKASTNRVPLGNFTVSYTLTSNGGATTYDSGSLAAGNWTGSGATIFVPYMPVGSGISRVLYFTNTSAASGTATISIRGEDATANWSGCTSAAPVTIKANAVTLLTTELNNVIAACAADAATDKLFVTISSTTPISNAEVYSAFTVDSRDRVTVANSSTGYKGNPGAASTENTRNVGQDNADNR